MFYSKINDKGIVNKTKTIKNCYQSYLSWNKKKKWKNNVTIGVFYVVCFNFFITFITNSATAMV